MNSSRESPNTRRGDGWKLTDRARNDRQFARSLFVAEDIGVGEAFTPENLRVVRPGHGLPPKYYETLLGKRVNRDVAKGTGVSWDLIG